MKNVVYAVQALQLIMTLWVCRTTLELLYDAAENVKSTLTARNTPPLLREHAKGVLSVARGRVLMSTEYLTITLISIFWPVYTLPPGRRLIGQTVFLMLTTTHFFVLRKDLGVKRRLITFGGHRRVSGQFERLEDRPDRGYDAFRQLADKVPDALLVVDAQGRIVFANEQAQHVFKMSSLQILGREVEHLIPERFRTTHPDFRLEYMKNPHARPMGLDMDISLLRSDGKEIPVYVSLGPFSTADGVSYVGAIIREKSNA